MAREVIGFYVSVIRDRRRALLRGPFSSHEEAIEAVEPTRARACTIDPWMDFDLFGTCRIEAETLPLGNLDQLDAVA
jgi:hypothetical protein